MEKKAIAAGRYLNGNKSEIWEEFLMHTLSRKLNWDLQGIHL
uniref:Uncharacterized protein n=1 Tax=Rhizophora mucronata TaxID=61149 RepID=A0A2P2NHU7_RHIMU